MAHAKQNDALTVIRQVAADFRAQFGRRSGGLLLPHKIWGAGTAVLGAGSAFDAIIRSVDELRGEGLNVGALGLRCYRPFPAHELAATLLGCERVVVVERAVAVGVGGIVSTDVRAALARLPVETHTVIAGLGGRDIAPRSLRPVLYRAARGHLGELTFLDLNRKIVRRSR